MRRSLAGLAGVYGALVLLHAPLLRLPYFWDEAGYFVFAGLDFFHHGWVVPHSTLANGHPPLLSVYLAVAWALGGFRPIVTRLAILVWAALLVAGVYKLARPRLRRGAAAAALLTALAPLVFAQSSLALLDLPVAALVVWALAAWERKRVGVAAVLLTAACLTKETAVIAVAALWLAGGREARRWPLLAPVAVLAAWFLFYHHVTGYWLGNPQYFAYNVGTTLSLPRIAIALLRRIWQLGFYDGMAPLTILALYAWARTRGQHTERFPGAWMALIAAYLGFHAVIGGAVLDRYLLPAAALYLIWIAEQLLRLSRRSWWIAGCAAWLVAGWFWNPPFPFPYEDNLAYAQFVRLHEAAARQLEMHPPAGPVVTAWPASEELSRPELGYVTHALPVTAVEDFTAASLRAVHSAPAALLLYSRIYQPNWDLSRALPFWSGWAQRFFGYDPAAPESVWLGRWGLRPVFQRAAAGQWVTIAVAPAPGTNARPERGMRWR